MITSDDEIDELIPSDEDVELNDGTNLVWKSIVPASFERRINEEFRSSDDEDDEDNNKEENLEPLPKRQKTRNSAAKAKNTNTNAKTKKIPKLTTTIEREILQAVTITAYIHVLKPSANSQAKPQKRTKNLDSSISRGPFRFLSSIPYTEFIIKIAETLPCSVENVVSSKITWKPQKPANAKANILGGDVGYQTLVEAMKNRKNDRVLDIFTPPPLKPTEEKMPWVESNEPEFDYSQFEIGSTQEHILTQKVRIDAAVKTSRAELEEKYPTGNNPCYPGKRVFKDSRGNLFDLNDGALTVWSAHLSRGSATIDSPPPSQFFDHKKRLCTHESTAQSHPPIKPSQPETAVALVSSITAAVLKQIQPSVPALIQPSIPALSPSESEPPPALSRAPSIPKQVLRNSISLTDFCEQYSIGNRDRVRLKKLEFEPGDDIEGLSRASWEAAGFQELSWDRTVAKNRLFLDDIQNGRGL